jgi:putative DNA primase/helicase
MPVSRAAQRLGWQGEHGEFGFLLGEQHITIQGPANDFDPDLDAPEEIDEVEKDRRESLEIERSFQRFDWQQANPKVSFAGRDAGDQQLAKAFHSAGEFQNWQKAVQCLEQYPRLQLAIYAALAAPLIDVVGGKNFAVDFCGPTSTGKTTALRVAASVFGSPGDASGTESLVRTFNTSRVGAERLMAVMCDVPVILDETKQVGRDEDVRQILYDLHSGRGRVRGSVPGLAANDSFRCVLIASGEAPITSIGTADGGSRVRAITLWGSPFDATDSSTNQIVTQLNREICKHYGHAGARFVRFLVDKRDNWNTWRLLYEELKTSYAERAGNNNFAGRLADYFAVLDLAAHVADEMHLTPWTFQDPIKHLWPVLTQEAQSADRSAAALEHVVSWSHSHAAEFKGRRSSSDRPPADGWAGIWDEDDACPGKRWRNLCFFTDKLGLILKHAGFDVDATLRTWKGRGWLRTDKGNGGDSRCTYSLKKGRFKLRVYAITRAAVEHATGASEQEESDRENPAKQFDGHQSQGVRRAVHGQHRKSSTDNRLINQ